MNMIKISFPGLGIEEFFVNPVAFTVPIFGGLEVRWYGLIITCGIVLAFLYAHFRSKQDGVSFDDLTDIALYTIIFAVIGARAYYVLTSLDKYDSFADMIAIWNGGLAIYGGLIAGTITVFVCCRIKKLSFYKLGDAVVPGVMIGQMLGRWGNFFNGEAHGGIVSEDSPLYFIRMGLYPHNLADSYGRMAYVHPTFLYESLWNLVGFILINLLYKKKKFDGQIILMYFTWYGFGRMFIEGLRTDSLYVGVFRISQVVGFVCAVVGGALLIYFLAKARRSELTARGYEAAYPMFETSATTGAEQTEDAANEAEQISETQTEKNESESGENYQAPHEFVDISDRLDRLFDTSDSKEKDETQK